MKLESIQGEASSDEILLFPILLPSEIC